MADLGELRSSSVRTVAVTLMMSAAAACSPSGSPDEAPERPAESGDGLVTPETSAGSAADDEDGLIITEPDLKVAFIGDQGLTTEAQQVLGLIRAEGADLIIHTGDLDYEGDPAAWDTLVTDEMGPRFPYFVTMGNHDSSAWDGPDGYRELAWERVADVEGVQCEGEYAELATCTFRGLWFLLSAVGIDDRTKTSHADFIAEQCNSAPYRWKVTNWHQNQTEIQVGDKNNETGWRVYEESRACGAIISTSHEHSYARTRTLTSMREQSVDPSCPSADEICVGPGRTFAFHSGLGGHSIRDQERCFPAEFPYGCRGEWANIYTATQDATYGALFITFHADGDPTRAEGYFKTIDGDVVDTFSVTAAAD